MSAKEQQFKIGDKVRVRHDVLDSVGISKMRAREFESHDWTGVVESHHSRRVFPYRVRVSDDDYGYDDFLTSELLLVTASTANTDGLASGVNATEEAGELARLRALVAKVAALELDAISPVDALSELYELRRDAAAALKGDK